MSKYIKPDCELGYVEDSAEINYLKFNNLRHTILGCMLGDFDNEGNYVVDPEIVKELISMPKYVVETMDNIEICLSELKLDKQISFLVTFEEDRATLTLVEKLSFEGNFKLNSGTYSNIKEYILDEVKTSGEVNRNVLYSRWNISHYPGNVIDIFSCDESVLEKYFGIVNRFKYLLIANAKLLSKETELEEAEAEYANAVLALIKRYPNLEKSVLAQLKNIYQEKQQFLQLNKPNYVKTFNEILDNAVLQNLGVLTTEQLIEFETDLRNIYLQTYLKRSGILEFETINNIERLSIQQLLSVSLQEIGADFVKAVKNHKEVDKTNNEELKKLMDYLISQKLIAIKKAEEEKTTELVKRAEEIKAQTKDAAKSADAGKASSKGGDKGKAKGGGGGSKSKSDKKSAAPAKKKQDDKSEDEKKKKLKEEEERRKKEEEEKNADYMDTTLMGLEALLQV